MSKKFVHGGRFYGRRTLEGPLEDASAADGPPDHWVCRRLRDFPHGMPEGGAVTACSRCGCAIVFNPARLATVPPATPKICMQCAGIQPLPIEES